MGVYEERQERLLQLLREAGDQPVTVAALRQGGIHAPATAVYELEVAGHDVEHVYKRLPSGGRRFVGYRLIEGSGPAARGAGPPRGRWKRPIDRARRRQPPSS